MQIAERLQHRTGYFLSIFKQNPKEISEDKATITKSTMLFLSTIIGILTRLPDLKLRRMKPQLKSSL